MVMRNDDACLEEWSNACHLAIIPPVASRSSGEKMEDQMRESRGEASQCPVPTHCLQKVSEVGLQIDRSFVVNTSQFQGKWRVCGGEEEAK